MQLGARRFSMRICLTDFIGTDNEKILMTYLEESRHKFEVAVVLKFWYNKNTISEKKLDNFVRTYKNILAHYGTKIYSIESVKNRIDDEAWFNVTSEDRWKDKSNFSQKTTYRFSYLFDNLQSPIWGCVSSFIELVNFHRREKPEKKPFKKRTFNDGSNSRFKKIRK